MKHPSLVGIDISGSSIKVLQIDDENNITAYGRGALEVGVVENGRILDKEKFSLTLNEILSNTKPEILSTKDGGLRSVLCLPESKLFTHYLALPDDIKKGEVKDFVLSKAQTIIPFETDDLYWDFHVAEEDGKRSVTFVGVKKEDLDNYVEAFTYANVKPAFICGELFALGYSLLPQTVLVEDYVVIDFGARSTTIGLFAVDVIANASIKVPYGGEYFTQKISERLNLSAEEAEKRKREYGLNPEHEDSGVPAIVRECLMEIIVKINEARVFFEEKTGNPIKHVVLTGGSSLLPNIQSFMSEQMSADVQLASPLTRIKNQGVFEKETPEIFFANVIGLAFYGNSKDRTRINLLNQYRYEAGDSIKEVLRIIDIRTASDFYYVLYSFTQRGKDFLLPRLGYLKKINFRLVLSGLLLIATIGLLMWVITNYT